jgi:hypothetical protein
MRTPFSSGLGTSDMEEKRRYTLLKLKLEVEEGNVSAL